MAQITTREFGYNAKNTSVTTQEMDTNFIDINEELKEKFVESELYENSITQSLHKSPNAISAMFVYDTSKDSDGGAWTDKCQNTSWYNESINGNWLGPKLSENDAICHGAILGSDIAINGNFTTDTNWTKGSGVTITGGKAVFTNVADNIGLTATVAPLVTNNYYTVTFTVSEFITGGVEILFGSTGILCSGITNGIFTVSGKANSTAFVLRANGTSSFNVDNISIKPVISFNTLPNDYFQLISDGKFYSLSKNYLTTTGTLATQTQFLNAGTYTISSTTGSSGSVAISGNATATHTAGTPTTFNVITSGNVVFTVTGSVLTAQVELGSVATTYSPNTSTTRYNETFRGNKREFPKLSALVAETANLTIYDLTEKDNPMWMRFQISTTLPVFGLTVASITALNNNIVVGANHATSGGLSIVSFINDTFIFYTTSSYKAHQNISQRNVAVTYDNLNTSGLVNRIVNTVAMAILPNAPIDPITGLKVPTIAVGTNGGLNIIKHDGSIIKSSLTTSRTYVGINNNLVVSGYGHFLLYWALKPELLLNNFAEIAEDHTTPPDFNYGVGLKLIGTNNKQFIRIPTSTTPNLVQLLHLNRTTLAKSISATIRNTYNTGYQVGDIRRTYLSSNTAETITTTTDNIELITNGNFDNGSSNWYLFGTPIFANGTVTITHGTSAGWQQIGQTIPGLIHAKGYKITVNVLSVTGYFRVTMGSSDLVTTRILYPGINTFYTTLTGADNNFHIGNGNVTTAGSIVIESVSLKYAEPDRSYKTKSANIYGTLTKTPVNTGSDLVQYSGFSNTNYLQESHSTELDFNTGEFNVSSWINVPVTLPSENFATINTELNTSPATWLVQTGVTNAGGGSYNFNTVANTSVYLPLPTTYNAFGLEVTFTVSNYINGTIKVAYRGQSPTLITANGTYTIKTVWSTTSFSDNSVYIMSYGGVQCTCTISNISVKPLAPVLIASRSYPNGAKIDIGMGGLGCLYSTLYDGTTTKTVTTLNSYNTGTPIKVSASYKFGKLGLSVNGKEVDTDYGLPLKALSGAWVEVAPQLASQSYIYSLAVFNGKLYGGTAPNGKLFEWNGSNAWIEVAPELASQTYIYSLAVFNGKLYGGTTPNGKLFEWNGSNAWVEVAPQLASQSYIFSLAVFNGKLYGGTYPNGKLFEWNGSNAWVEVAPQLASQTYILSLAVFNGKLYGGTYPNGKLFEWNGSNAWIEVAPQLAGQTHIFSLAVFNGGSGDKLYGGTTPNGKLFEWNGSNAWIEVAPQLAGQTYIQSLAVFNGGSGDKLYGGTYPDGKLFEWNGSNAWVEVAPQLAGQTYIQSLAVFNGGSGDKLYSGTRANGKLFEWNGYGTNSTLTIGNNADLNSPFPGSISLVKLSGTVPTKEQELFMYEQEKQLFNENAKCTIPDTTAIIDVTFDDLTDTWNTTTTTNSSTWSGLVRNNNTTPSLGTFTKVAQGSGVSLITRDEGTSLDGMVDIILPKYSVYKDFINNYNNANKTSREPMVLDFVAGFNGTLTVGTNSITSITNLSYPTDIIGATITGTNIPANTTILDISGTTIYISNLITQGAGANDISFKDYVLPLGYECISVLVSGNTKIEGSTKDYVKLYDGFVETVSFNTAPAYNLPVQIQIVKAN